MCFGRKLCKRSSEDHWELRDFSAKLVASICDKFGDIYRNLQPQISQIYLKALLDPQRALTSHYGAIMGIISLGPWAVRLLLFPNLQKYSNLLEPELSNNNVVKRKEAQKCFEALERAKNLMKD